MNKRVLGREMPPMGVGCWAMGGGATTTNRGATCLTLFTIL